MSKLVALALVLLVNIGFSMAEVVSHTRYIELVVTNSIKSKDSIKDNILRIYPNATISDFYLEKEYGRYLYEVMLTDDKNQHQQMVYDASTGTLLKNERSR